jgi:hypothetical protein
VAAAQQRRATAALTTAVEDEVACCYAVQDKMWVDAPDAEAWEIYTVLADAEMPDGQRRAAEPDTCGPGACCATSPAAVASACCDQPVGV